jgi:hypothetical protein
MRSLRWFAAPVALLLLTASPAQAALTKIRQPIPLAQNFRVIGICEFPVVVTDVAGQGTLTTVLDDAGDVIRIEIRGRFVTEFTNELTGATVTANSAGPITIIPQDDGTEIAIHRGQHVLADDGLLTGEPILIHHTGLIVVTARFNPETGFVDFISIDRVGVTTDLCARLAG